MSDNKNIVERQFTFYEEWFSLIQFFPENKQLEFLKIIIQQGLYNDVDIESVSADLRPLFLIIENRLRRAKEAYERKSKAGRKGMQKRWDESKQQFTDEDEEKVKRIVKCWNGLKCVDSVLRITDERKKKVLNILSEFPESEFIHVINNISNNSFFTGKNKSGWKITFDWLLDNHLKVFEKGNNNKQNTNSAWE